MLNRVSMKEVVEYIPGDFFPGGKIYYLNRRTVQRICKQQDLKIWRLSIFIQSCFPDGDAAVRFNID